MRYWYLVLAALVCSVLLATPVMAQEDGAAEDQYQDAPETACLDTEELVETFTGTQDRTTDEFQITGPEWRFISEIRPRTVTTGGMEVDALNEDNFTVGFTTQIVFPDETFNRQSSGVIDGPGTFRLRIEADGVEYRIIVCQEIGGQEEEREEEQEDLEDPRQDDRKRGLVDRSIPKKDLPHTSGPSLLLPLSAGLLLAGGLGVSLLRRR